MIPRAACSPAAGPEPFPVARCSLVIGFLVLAVTMCLPGARAGDMHAASMGTDAADGTASVLDGRAFRGKVGHAGEDPFAEDVWIFDEGMFMSEKCIECGYSDSPYWVRFEEEGVRFMSESRCPVTDATIVWRGVVTGDRIQGTFTWTKERWYWTVEKEFWFEGRLVDLEVAMTVQP